MLVYLILAERMKVECIDVDFLREQIDGVPTGIRTPVTAVKGRCPRPLDDRNVAR